MKEGSKLDTKIRAAVENEPEEVRRKLENIVDTTQEIIPLFEREANNIIKKHAFIATGAGLIPIPGADVVAVTGVQTVMMQSLAQLYNVPYEEEKMSTIMTSLTTTSLSRIAALGVSKFFDAFGQFGSLSDNLTSAAVAGFATAAVGEVYKLHFQSGGTIDSLEFSDFWEYFQKKISDGDLSHNTFTGFESAFKYLSKQ